MGSGLENTILLEVIGIDSAVNPRNVGLATGVIADGAVTVTDVTAGSSKEAIVDYVAGRIQNVANSLIAIDAPLGWPQPLAEALAVHEAGQPLQPTANAMFRRLTDDVIADRLRKRPLDVGADRIARTAHAALALLAEIREATGRPIPVAWSPGTVDGTAVIEVYPGGTLVSRRLPERGYKKRGAEAATVREKLVRALRTEAKIADEMAAAMIASDHVLDAVLCVLAASDFVRGDVLRPEDEARARREGWIWVRPLA